MGFFSLHTLIESLFFLPVGMDVLLAAFTFPMAFFRPKMFFAGGGELTEEEERIYNTKFFGKFRSLFILTYFCYTSLCISSFIVVIVYPWARFVMSFAWFAIYIWKKVNLSAINDENKEKIEDDEDDETTEEDGSKKKMMQSKDHVLTFFYLPVMGAYVFYHLYSVAFSATGV